MSDYLDDDDDDVSGDNHAFVGNLFGFDIAQRAFSETEIGMLRKLREAIGKGLKRIRRKELERFLAAQGCVVGESLLKLEDHEFAKPELLFRPDGTTTRNHPMLEGYGITSRVLEFLTWLDRNDGPADGILDAVSGSEKIEYSSAIESPMEWAKQFGWGKNAKGSREFSRRIKDGSIRVDPVTSKRYRVAIKDLPASHPESRTNTKSR